MSSGVKRARAHRRLATGAAVVAVAVALTVAGCSSTGRSTVATDSTVRPTTSVGGGGSGPQTSTGSTVDPPGGTTGSPTTLGAPSTSTADPGSTLLAPTGTFLSSHRLALTGTEAPTRARSVCQTTPGASCTIEFTMTGTTRSLPARVVDDSGVVAWDWSPADVGLTAGHWDVRIVATLGSAREAVDEAIGLEVV